VTASDQLRQRLGGLSGERLARAAARLRPGADVTKAVLHRLGRRVERLSHEVVEVDRRLVAILTEIAPALLEECGVGPVCAAQLLVSSGDPTGWRAKRPPPRSLAPALSTPQADNNDGTA
jgi:transposase